MSKNVQLRVLMRLAFKAESVIERIGFCDVY